MRLLIVEDSDNIVKMYQHVLEGVIKDNGFAKKIGELVVDVADSYKTFKKEDLASNKYDIAIVDWKLEKGTAEPILKSLNGNCKSTTIISGYADNPGYRKLWNKMGIDDAHIKDKYIGLKTIESIFKEAIDAIQV